MEKHYYPAGVDDTFQSEVTKLIHKLLLNDGKTTLSRIGYIGAITLVSANRPEIYLLFSPELACTTVEDLRTFRPKIVPSDDLNCLSNYFFVGNLTDSVSLQTRPVRRHSIISDETGRNKHIVFKYGKNEESSADIKIDYDVEVMAIRCNPDITLAAINNHSLEDPTFSWAAKQIAKGASKKKGPDKSYIITQSDANSEYPIELVVQMDPTYEGYNPNQALPYLSNVMLKARQAYKRRCDLQNDAGAKAKKVEKKDKSGMDFFKKFT